MADIKFRTTSIVEVKHEAEELSAGIELDLADPVTLEWEKSVSEEMLRHSAEDIIVLANVGRRYTKNKTCINVLHFNFTFSAVIVMSALRPFSLMLSRWS